MVDEFGDVTEIVAGLVLASVDRLALPVPAACDMELPLSILHQLVVSVVWANKDLFRFGHWLKSKSEFSKN